MRRLSGFLCGMALVLAITGTAHAAILLFEDFEDSSGFTVNDGFALYWGIAPLGGTAALPSYFQQGGSQSGAIFYGSWAEPGSVAKTLTIALPDLSGYTNLMLTVALAAPDQDRWENTHRDSLHILGGTEISPPVVPCTTAGCLPVANAIDSFVPTGRPGNLQSLYSSIQLQPQFQDFEYAIDSSLRSLTFAFASSAGDEVVGIDSVTITGDPIVVAPVAIDIKPQSCPNPINVKSRGVLPVAILGTAEFDVITINPASIRVVGVPPLRSALEDVATPFTPFNGEVDASSCTVFGPDGFMDLTLKLDTQQVVAALGDVIDGDVLILTLTGNSFDGAPIQGQDVVVILKKGNE